MIYVDATVFVSALLDPLGPAKHAVALLKRIAHNEVEAVTSLLTWDEVVWVVQRRLSKPVAVERGRKLLEFPNLILANVDGTVLRLAQDLHARHHLNPRDAIHAATALSFSAEVIVSGDTDLDAVEEIGRVPVEKFGSDGPTRN